MGLEWTNNDTIWTVDGDDDRNNNRNNKDAASPHCDASVGWTFNERLPTWTIKAPKMFQSIRLSVDIPHLMVFAISGHLLKKHSMYSWGTFNSSDCGFVGGCYQQKNVSAPQANYFLPKLWIMSQNYVKSKHKEQKETIKDV